MIGDQVQWAVVILLAGILLKDVLLKGIGSLTSGQSSSNQRLATIEAEISALRAKQSEHDGLLIAVTRLEERVGQMTAQLANQAPVIAQVVAMTIKETFSALGVRRSAVSA